MLKWFAGALAFWCLFRLKPYGLVCADMIRSKNRNPRRRCIRDFRLNYLNKFYIINQNSHCLAVAIPNGMF
jgi:hypothetical protein